MSGVVHADALSRRFGDTDVVRRLSVDVDEGQIHGVIGPSGSGKTTTVRMMAGVLAPSSGTVTVFDTDPRKLGTAARQRIGYMPQLGVLYPELSVADNLRFTAALYGVRKAKQRIAEVLDMLDMDGTQSLRLDKASGGMQRRVALAGALLHEPRLLFLDEPTAGLDPVLRRKVWDHLHELRDDGCTALVTTQVVSEATSCDSVSLIVEGRLVAGGPPDELRRLAHGGEVVHLHLTARATTDLVEAIADHPTVSAATILGSDGRTLRVVGDSADDVIEAMGPFLTERDVELRLAERHLAPFDDVFVELLERHTPDTDTVQGQTTQDTTQDHAEEGGHDD